MAELFLAQQPPNSELVVLKRILPYLSEEPEFVQMFLDEAKIAAQLHHPNIVQVYELGKLDNTIFIAMEFVEGIDLRRVMQEESKFGANVPYGVAAAICAQVASGLDYAHNSVAVDGRPLELIHRDVSPQNVMIAYDGRVKLVDFGIAKAGAFIEARSKPGVIKGKFLYLSPEQVAQLTLDHRADIFALGTMMYEITTGKSPFAKPTTEGILYAIRSEDPSPPHLLRDDYPQELSRIIMRCLVKDRNLRYQRAAEVAEDLEAFVNSPALRQSTDIADYIARLMGEEEERTVLHIPVAAPKGRKEATLAMPAGLTGRPVRRPSSDKHAAPPEYTAEPEPPTQMARSPGRLPTRPERVEVSTQANAYVPPAAEARDAEAEGDVSPQALENALSDVPEEQSEAGDEAGQEASYRTGQQPVFEDGNDPAFQTGPGKVPDFEEEEEQEEATAIGGFPAGFVMPEPGESTVEERGRGRGSGTTAAVPPASPSRRPTPPVDRDTEPRARRPSPPPARRPLVDEEASQSISLTQPTANKRIIRDGEDDDGAESVSVTPPTVGQRPGSRQFAKAVVREEDSVIDTESGVSEVEHTDSSQAYRPEVEPDAEDDESTAGYEHEHEVPVRRGGRGVLLAVVAVLVLVVLGVVAFLALSSSPSQPSEEDTGPPPAQPMKDPNAPPVRSMKDPIAQPDQLAEAAPEAPPAAGPGTEPEPAAEAQPANPTGETEGTPGGTPPGESPAPSTAVAAAAPAGEKPPDATPGNTATAPTEPPLSEPAKPTGIPVKFKTSSNTATIWVNGRKVEANKTLQLPGGTIRVRFVCSTHKRASKGSFVKTLAEGQDKPKEFSIPCRKGHR
jgi:serine/threonine protein kinase